MTLNPDMPTETKRRNNPDLIPLPLPPLKDAHYAKLEFGKIYVSIPENARGIWSRNYGRTTEFMKILDVSGPKTEGRIPKVSLVNVGTDGLTPAHIAGTWIRNRDVSDLL